MHAQVRPPLSYGTACSKSLSLAWREQGGKGAVPVADLDQVAEDVVRLVGVRLVPVVAVEGGNWLQGHGELPAAGQGKGPAAGAAWRPRVVVRGE